ncbi:DUF3012 domain-containing protein [Marinimicrobium alkaliphilum]|uniref:DUF3012 domain-containing protein n=1 Tax=Marinimicrobium alkaliphilum TaxID=2202654 RepID=UPI000DBA39F3|nr:DUF3012 domain-containing protein [Marinimicrobium alkaliphilum]
MPTLIERFKTNPMWSAYLLIGVSILFVIGGLVWLASQPAPLPEEPPVPEEPALDASTYDRGSEQWCDAMLEIDGMTWSEDDTRDFSQHCLYD